MESGKNIPLIVWAGVAAAATGIVAVAMIAKWRERSLNNLSATTRSVHEVLADCYGKVREIEEHLPDVVTPRAVRRPAVRKMTNSNPVLET